MSRPWRKLKTDLDKHFQEHGPPHITKVVSIGLGSLTDPANKKLHEVGIMFQFVMMKVISNLVGTCPLVFLDSPPPPTLQPSAQ